MEFNSIPFINSILDFFSSLCSHPLFSTIVTLHTLILLYIPSLFTSIAFSPIFNSTGILLLSLLRLGADEKLKKESDSLESRILDSDANQRSKKESNSSDSNHNHPKWPTIEKCDLSLCSGMVIESNSMESRFLDFIDQNVEPMPKTGLSSKSNQTQVKFEPKSLGLKFNQTDMGFEFKTILSMESDHAHVEFEPKTSLGLESYQTDVKFEPKTGLGLEFNQTHVESEPKAGLDSESNQAHVESEPKAGLASKFNQTHVESEPKTDLELESHQAHVESKPKTNLGSESYKTHVESEPKTGTGSSFDKTHVETESKTGIDSESNSHDGNHKWVLLEEDPIDKTDWEQMDHGSGSIQLYEDPFLQWNIRAPLEIIYEAYEGEEEEEDEEEENESNRNDGVFGEKRVVGPDRYPSLSMYYPESETDSSSDGEFPTIGNWDMQEGVFFRWEEEEREELIEISLDRYGKKSIEFCHVEEDNLIEIDIFPTRS